MSKYLIIGGVAGGATTAARLRRVDENAEIILFERGKEISYANCGLPYYIGGVISERDKLLVQTPEDFYQRFRVEVRIQNEVTGINRDKQSLEVKNLQTGEVYEETYDKLIVSPGADPLKPNIPGIKDSSIFTLRNVQDTDHIKEYIEENQPKRAVVVGAGFIGLEMAENLYHRGIFVTIVEMAEQVMTPLDYEMAAEVHQHLKTKNVEFFLKDGVASFHRDDDKLFITLNSGRELEADLVILSIGIRPESQLIKDSGLEVGKRGGIVVNEYLQTADPNIYAVGDAIEFPNPITKKSVSTYLAGPANKQGRIVADNVVFGNQRVYPGAISTAIAKVFDLTVASCGVPEKELSNEGIPYVSSIIHGTSHAGYYPNAMPLTLKILFDTESGRVYGTQIIGYEGVDKRIDVISTVMRQQGTIYDLEEIEHAYAPPFSSAKDPVNIAGFTAENIMRGRMNILHWYDIQNLDDKSTFLLDVRTPEEFQMGTIEGSVNVEVDQIRDRMEEIPKDKKIVVFCGVGLRGYVAGRILMQHGYDEVYNLSGGYKTYQHATQKQSNEDIFEKDFIGKDDQIYQYNHDRPKAPVDVKTMEVDACGLQCPGPIMKLKQSLQDMNEGDRIKETASDPGFYEDVKSWAKMTGNKLVSLDQEKGKVIAVIEKHTPKDTQVSTGGGGQNKTLIVFSIELDKALASFVLANGAASTGKKVTMFFTFWGLNVIKKPKKQKVKKDFMGKMFGWMMPANSHKLKLSKFNMMNMGRAMIKGRMKAKGVDSLESMMQSAIDNGVEMIACQMSMDIMGIKKEELMDEVRIGGVATYMGEAEQSNVNLFV
ncbi:MAG: CoA-disulfide reductase [Bacteroidetes bacterium]|jgi:NADPH-dependent 2,4-dienoyl-CoA reductase/sulfur reductase-like enzyme/peroxiredoxin family protein/rhodanese-related sulfurtransferase/TusA-related sulfurtransferase|nr:CoA-disulfide reductase [Bacteroidota bacterium]